MSVGTCTKLLLFSFVMLSSSSALAQFSQQERAALSNLGFKIEEISDAEMSQILPHYLYFEQWRSCAQMMLQNSDSDSVAEAKKIVRLCQSQEGELKASLGAQIGLARANRAVSALRYTLANSRTSALIEQKKRATTEAAAKADRRESERKLTFWYSSDWRVLKVAHGTCIAERTRVDDADYPELMVVPLNGTVVIRFYSLDEGQSGALNRNLNKTFTILSELYDGVDSNFKAEYIVRNDNYTPFYQLDIRMLPRLALRASHLSLNTADVDNLGSIAAASYRISGLTEVFKKIEECKAS